MGYPTKIATCCYCGTKAALVLKGRERHELSCSGCGAPLHDLKMLPSRKTESHKIDRRSGCDTKPHKKKKKKKSGLKRFGSFLEDAFDVIEDILD
ncbi:MAG: hypothetical protein AB3N23_08290 [Paracoccaceae bacterium]